MTLQKTLRDIRQRLRYRPTTALLSLLVAAVIMVPALPVQAVSCVMTEDGNGDVILSSDCTITAGTYNITRDFVVSGGVTVTAAGNTGGGTGVIINAGRNIDIQGALTANGQGYTSDSGPGAGGSDWVGSGGGSHGGKGGHGDGGSGDGGSEYGSASAPVTLGSGGGDNCGPGGTGGGAIKLSATDTLTVDGTVTADGTNTAVTCRGGGGAGGSVWLEAATLAGTGSVSANGSASGGYGQGGGGAGGRVAVLYANDASNLISNSAIYAYGGSSTSSNSLRDGGAGTIFLDDTDDASPNGALKLDNQTRSFGNYTTQLNASETYDSLTIQRGTKYRIASGQTLTVASGGSFSAGGSPKPTLVIASGGTFDPGQASFSLSGIDVSNSGDLATVTNLSLSNVIFTQASTGDFPGTVTALSLASASTFTHQGSGLNITDGANLTMSGSSVFNHQSSTGFGSGLDIDTGAGTLNVYDTSLDNLNSLTVSSGGVFAQYHNASIAITTVTVGSGGSLTHGANTSAQSYILDIVATDISVQASGTVSALNKGYGPGLGTGQGQDNWTGSGGGGYGGYGGLGNGAGTGGSPYGSVRQPYDLGSGGGDDAGGGCGNGGSGGGLIKLTVSGTLTVDGTVTAAADNTGITCRGGGGSGGSVWLDVATLAGTGSVSANGSQSGDYGQGGGGSGGRVAVYYTTDTSTLVSADHVTAYGGTQLASTSNGNGAAGTVFIDDVDDGNANGTLIVDNNENGNNANTTMVVLASQVYDYLYVRSAAKLVIPSGFNLAMPSSGSLSGGGTVRAQISVDSGGLFDLPTIGAFTLSSLRLVNAGSIDQVTDLTLDNAEFIYSGGNFPAGLNSLTVKSGGTFEHRTTSTLNVAGTVTVEPGGTITHTANTSAKSYLVDIAAANIDVQVGGTVSGNYLGYTPGNGPGKGGNGGCGAGGGFGGNGGYASSGCYGDHTGGPTYGSVTQPADLGSPGGYGYAGTTGNGGGAVKLTASGTLTVNGTVSVNGADYTGPGGAGSGGSVWLDAATLAGTGSVTANGGVGASGGNGAGGGGRVAVYWTTDSSTLVSGDKLHAYGGGSYFLGGAGTVYLKAAAAANGDLLVDNNNLNGSYTTQFNLPSGSQTYDNLSVINGSKYVIPDTYILTVASSGAFTGGGSTRPSLTVNSGGTFNPPSASLALTNIDLTNNGTVGLATSLTLSGSTVTHNGDFSASVTDLTFSSASTFIHNGTGFADPTLTVGNSSSFIWQTASDPGLTSLTVESTGTFEQRRTGALTAATITVQSGGTVIHTANTSTKSYEVNLSGTTVDVQLGGTVSGNSRGYTPGNGPGKGANGGCGPGGGYGGRGGDSSTGCYGDHTGGATYGSVTQPVDMGSPGGYGYAGTTGNGGGVVKLAASGTLTVDGTVSANGADYTGPGGAGSGGSVWLASGSLVGSGSVTANGGLGAIGGSGAGGGGRIAVYYTTDSSTLISGDKLHAYGGGGYFLGGAGTVYLKAAAATNGDLLVDNNGQNGANTEQATVASQTYDVVTVRNRGKYVVPDTFTLAVASAGSLTGSGTSPSITVNSGGQLTLPNSGVDGVNLTNNGTLASGNTSMSNANATWLNNASVSGVTDFSCAGGTCTNTGTFVGGLLSLTVGSGGNFIQTATTPLFSGSDLIIENGGTFTQNNVEPIVVGLLQVQTGGTLTHSDNAATKTAQVNISATTVEIQSGAVVEANGLGYDGSTGTGQGGDAAAGGGAAYGGSGGDGYVSSVSQANGSTTTYGDSAAPTDLGSGGGDDTNVGGQQGGGGGGAVKIVASGTFTVNGTIRANGAAGTANEGGGGSGGSIWIQADTWAGTTGVITADGGSGSGNDTNGGGCGGGGRIRIFYGTKTYSGSAATADSGCAGLRAGTAGSLSEEANAPTFSSLTHSPTPTFTYDPVAVSATASFASGIASIDLYLDSTASTALIHTCSYSPATTPASCDYTVGTLARGGHTIYAKAYGPLAQEGTASDSFSVAAWTADNLASLSSLKAGDTAVDFILTFTLAGESTGTLTVTFPAGFTVTQAPSAGGSSGCLSNFGSTAQTMTADKTACNGVVTLAGGQVTNPATPGTYTIEWNNDYGQAQVYITDDDAVSVYSNVDPSLTFDLDVSVSDGESSAPYLVDLGALSSASPVGSGISSIPSIWIDLATNATSGAAVTVRSANAALRSTSAPADQIASQTETLASNNEGYGICVASATGTLRTETPALTFSAQTPYADSGNCTAGTFSVGLLQTSDQDLLIASGPINAGRSQLRIGASASVTTAAHPDYADVLIFIATATY